MRAKVSYMMVNYCRNKVGSAFEDVFVCIVWLLCREVNRKAKRDREGREGEMFEVSQSVSQSVCLEGETKISDK